MGYKFVLLEKLKGEEKENVVGVFNFRHEATLAGIHKFRNSGAKYRVVTAEDYGMDFSRLTHPPKATHIYGYAVIKEGVIVELETTKPSRIYKNTFIRHEGFTHTKDGYHFKMNENGVLEYYAPYHQESVHDFKLKTKKRVKLFLAEYSFDRVSDPDPLKWKE